MPRRRHIGPVYAMYPAAAIANFLGGTLYKIAMTLLLCLVWTGIYYVIIGIVNFMKTEILEEGRGVTTARDIFRSEPALWILVISYGIIFLIVLKTKTGSKGKVRRKKNPNE